MVNRGLLLVIAGTVFLCGEGIHAQAQQVAVYFSPDGGCQDAIVREISSARESLYVEAYSFTSAPIAKAIVEAFKRGVAVAVILDKSQLTEQYSVANYFKTAGVPTFIDRAFKIAHNKVIVVDRQTVVTGSYNFTKSAEHDNAENLLIIRHPGVAQAYLTNWQKLRGLADPMR